MTEDKVMKEKNEATTDDKPDTKLRNEGKSNVCSSFV